MNSFPSKGWRWAAVLLLSSATVACGGSEESWSADEAGGGGVEEVSSVSSAATLSPRAGLFITQENLTRARTRMTSSAEPYAGSYRQQRDRANAALTKSPAPFRMTTVTDAAFGWCGDSKDGKDNSLADLTGKLEEQMDTARTLAMQYALTKERKYGDRAVLFLTEWAEKSTLINLYDFRSGSATSPLNGATEDYCSRRPWNFALDAMWQTYGAINAADAYLLLTLNGYTLSSEDNTQVRRWLKALAEAINSSHRTWTEWADEHPKSSAYKRYRSDNHLSWSIAGLAAVGIALGDKGLIGYALEGGSWTDSRGGAYANPSYPKTIIDGAIEAGEKSGTRGRVYEELICREPPVGYSLFHLWALQYVARMAYVWDGRDVWGTKGADGAGLWEAYARYPDFIRGKRTAACTPKDGDLKQYVWLYELASQRWSDSDFKSLLSLTDRSSFIEQGIGPVTFLLGK